jgi:hypothetical protein
MTSHAEVRTGTDGLVNGQGEEKRLKQQLAAVSAVAAGGNRRIDSDRAVPRNGSGTGCHTGLQKLQEQKWWRKLYILKSVG